MPRGQLSLLWRYRCNTIKGKKGVECEYEFERRGISRISEVARWNWVIRTHFPQGERQCDCSWILGFWSRKEAVIGRFVLHLPVPCVERIQSNFKRQEYRNLLSWSYLISNHNIYFSLYKFVPCRGGVRMTFGPIVFLDTFFLFLF